MKNAEQILKKYFALLVAFELLLVTAYLSTKFLVPEHVIEIFDLDGESNLGSWFSASQLLLIGFVCLAIHLFSKNSIHQFPKPIFLIGFFVFVFLSCDEASTIHEKVNHLFDNLAIHQGGFKDNMGLWILPYLCIMVGVLLWIKSSLFILWKAQKSNFKIAFSGSAIFLLGAVMLEIISYQYLRNDQSKTLYYLEVAAEEFFEMLGATIILYAVVKIFLSILPAKLNQPN